MLYAPKPMHIPDGFLSVAVAVVMWIIPIVVIAYALETRRQGPGRAPGAAHGRAGSLHLRRSDAQLLRGRRHLGPSAGRGAGDHPARPVGGGAGVDLRRQRAGAALPGWRPAGAGCQHLQHGHRRRVRRLFHLPPMQRLVGGKRWGLLVGGFAAGWLSIFIASLAAALELALSGTSPANIAVPAMGGIHALIGIGEGLITVGALAFMTAARPDLVGQWQTRARGAGPCGSAGWCIALVLAIASPLASAHPDGLEWVAEQKGFLEPRRGRSMRSSRTTCSQACQTRRWPRSWPASSVC